MKSDSECRSINVCIISKPTGNAGAVPLSNLIRIIQSISDNTYVIMGRDEEIEIKNNFHNIHFIDFRYIPKSNVITKILYYIYIQIWISFKIIQLRKKITICVYVLDSQAYFIPVHIGWLLGKENIFLIAASILGSFKVNRNILTQFEVFSESINFKKANRIILYSQILVTKWDMKPFIDKILIAGHHFIDFDTFTVTTHLSDRPYLIGYIGRLSPEKGVQNFVQALPVILNSQKNLKVFIGGAGQLKKNIVTTMQLENLTDRVDIPGWISHDALPHYLNQLHLLIIPSYTEGLPNIMLEAMACGTPVLATPVGGIPDVIRDGETGFIMENNSPECIARNVIRVLSSPELARIAENGRQFVEKNFTFERAVDRWKKVLLEI